MITENITIEKNSHPHLKCISWTAIFAGALVAVGLGFLLNLFALAISLSLFTLNKEGATVLAIGGFLGLVIGIIASMSTAGYTAGYLGRSCCLNKNLGILYGFTTWVISLLLAALLTGYLTQYTSIYTTTTPNSSMSTQISKPAADTSIKTTLPGSSDEQKNIQINTSKEKLAGAAFIIFALFFIGALSACISAFLAMDPKKNELINTPS